MKGPAGSAAALKVSEWQEGHQADRSETASSSEQQRTQGEGGFQLEHFLPPSKHGASLQEKRLRGASLLVAKPQKESSAARSEATLKDGTALPPQGGSAQPCDTFCLRFLGSRMRMFSLPPSVSDW